MDEVDGMASKKQTDEILGLGLRTDVTWIVVIAWFGGKKIGFVLAKMHPFFGNSADNDARMQTSPVNGLKLCVRIAGKTVEKNSLTGAYRTLIGKARTQMDADKSSQMNTDKRLQVLFSARIHKSGIKTPPTTLRPCGGGERC